MLTRRQLERVLERTSQPAAMEFALAWFDGCLTTLSGMRRLGRLVMKLPPHLRPQQP